MRCVAILFSMRRDQLRGHQITDDATYRDDSSNTDIELDITTGKNYVCCNLPLSPVFRFIGTLQFLTKTHVPFYNRPHLDTTLESFALDWDEHISNFYWQISVQASGLDICALISLAPAWH
jgi:hypothetical protein